MSTYAATPTPITTVQLRAELRRTLDRVVYFDERLVVLRNGEQVAVLLGVEAYRRLVGASGRPVSDCQQGE